MYKIMRSCYYHMYDKCGTSTTLPDVRYAEQGKLKSTSKHPTLFVSQNFANRKTNPIQKQEMNNFLNHK